MLGTVLQNCLFSDIYMTNSPETCLYQVRDSGAKVIVCDTYKRLKERFLVNEQALVELGV